MIRTFLKLVAVVLVILVVLAFFQPNHFSVSRSVVVSAPRAVVFGQVNTLRSWELWSPWVKLDPSMKKSYDGPDAGPGSVYRWSGNDSVGEGRSTIVESRPDDFIRLKLEFVRPFEAINDVDFNFRSEEQGTRVTWTISGENSFLAKAISLFVDMDQMVGGQFEEGLNNLKREAEKVAKI